MQLKELLTDISEHAIIDETKKYVIKANKLIKKIKAKTNSRKSKHKK